MRFKFTANAEFEAEHLDDAFIKLSKHFEYLFQISEYTEEDLSNEKDELDFRGAMEIEPIK